MGRKCAVVQNLEHIDAVRQTFSDGHKLTVWTDGNGGCARGVRAKKSDRVINWTELIPNKMEAHNVAAASRIEDVNEVAVLCDRVGFAAERRLLIGKRERGTLNPKYRDLAASSIYGEKQRVVFT